MSILLAIYLSFYSPFILKDTNSNVLKKSTSIRCVRILFLQDNDKQPEEQLVLVGTTPLYRKFLYSELSILIQMNWAGYNQFCEVDRFIDLIRDILYATDDSRMNYF